MFQGCQNRRSGFVLQSGFFPEANLRLKFFSLGVTAIFSAITASAQHTAPPTKPNGMYDMTTLTPIPMGTCSGEAVGCTTVYGMDWLSDGRMVLLTSDYIGHGPKPAARPRSKVSIVSTPIGPSSTVTTIASNFKQPTGLKVVNDKIWVSDIDSIYMIPNNNPAPSDTLTNRQPRFGAPLSTMYGGDGPPNNFVFPSNTCSGLTCTTTNSQWHHYIMTPVYYQGKFYAAYGSATYNSSGVATLSASSYFDGALLSWDSSTTALDSNLNRAAGGLRSPNGTALGPNGSVFVSDHQGSWLPMCTITRYNINAPKKQFGGYRQDPGFTPNWAQAWYDRGAADYVPPVAINRYDQTGHTGWVGIGQPFWLTQGPYAGQLLVGDINSRGMWRVAFDTLPDTTGAENIQGAVFYFTPGSADNSVGTGASGINRISQGPDGTIYAGSGRSVGNWAGGPSQYLIYVFKPKANPTQFEVKSIRSLKDGYELILNKKVNPATVSAARISVGQRSWARQSAYGLGFVPTNNPNATTGAPQYTNRTIDSIYVSLDSLRIRLKVPGILRINQGRRGDSVTHWHTEFTFTQGIRSATGDSLYTTEAAYAQNWINTTREWTGGKLNVVALASRRFSALENNVWFTGGSGILRVNVDNTQSYTVFLRDTRGRVLEERAGRPGVATEFKAPGNLAVYIIEVRSSSDSYSKLVAF